MTMAVMISHIGDCCLLTKLDGGLSLLHLANEADMTLV